MMNDMLYSFSNVSAVAEEMEQFKDMLKLTAAMGEYNICRQKMNFLQIAIGLKRRMREYSVSNTISSNGCRKQN